MSTLVNLKRFLKRPTYLDGTCYVPQCSNFFRKIRQIQNTNWKIEFLKKFLFFGVSRTHLVLLFHTHTQTLTDRQLFFFKKGVCSNALLGFRNIYEHLREFGKIWFVSGEITRFLPEEDHYGYLKEGQWPIFNFLIL